MSSFSPITFIVSVQSVSQFSLSVVSNSLRPMNRSMPGFPLHHQLPEFTQTHVHLVSDAIQPSHPLSSPSPPAPNPSQHQGLFQWVNSSHEVAKVLEFQKTRKQSFASQGERLSKKLTLLTPWSLTSSFQNCEKTHFCCLNHPGCSSLLWQP